MIVEAGEEDDREGMGDVQGSPAFQQQSHEGQELRQIHWGWGGWHRGKEERVEGEADWTRGCATEWWKKAPGFKADALPSLPSLPLPLPPLTFPVGRIVPHLVGHLHQPEDASRPRPNEARLRWRVEGRKD